MMLSGAALSKTVPCRSGFPARSGEGVADAGLDMGLEASGMPDSLTRCYESNKPSEAACSFERGLRRPVCGICCISSLILDMVA